MDENSRALIETMLAEEEYYFGGASVGNPSVTKDSKKRKLSISGTSNNDVTSSSDAAYRAGKKGKSDLGNSQLSSQALPSHKTKWTEAENQLLINGLKTYGHGNWKAIAALVGTRNSLQVKNHARHLQNADKIKGISTSVSVIKLTNGNIKVDSAADDSEIPNKKLIRNSPIKYEQTKDVNDDIDVDLDVDIDDDTAPNAFIVNGAVSVNVTDGTSRLERSRSSNTSETVAKNQIHDASSHRSTSNENSLTRDESKSVTCSSGNSDNESLETPLKGSAEPSASLAKTIRPSKDFTANDLNEDSNEINANNHMIIDLSSISAEELEANAEWFNSRAPAKTPERYLKIRNYMVNVWRALPEPKGYLSKTRARAGLKDCGDVNAIGRVHAYLEAIGVINTGLQATGTGGGKKNKIATGSVEGVSIPKCTLSPTAEDLSDRPRRRKVRDENGRWVDERELEGRVVSHEAVSARNTRPSADVLAEYEAQRLQAKNARYFAENEMVDNENIPKHKRASYYSGRTKAKALAEESVSGTGYDPFRLIPPRRAPGLHFGNFRLRVQSNVMLVMDFHAHLAHTEVIGLLGGTYNPHEAMIDMVAAFPCKSLSTGVQCEMDPASEMQARDHFTALGLTVVGWYHSHPTFAPHPSIRDLENQAAYQTLFRRLEDGVEPFVGAIVSPYDTRHPSDASKVVFTTVGFDVDLEGGYRIPQICDKEVLPSQTIPVDIFHQISELVKEYRSYEYRVDFSVPFRRGEPTTRGQKFIQSLRSNIFLSDAEADAFIQCIAELLEKGFSAGGKFNVKREKLGIYQAQAVDSSTGQLEEASTSSDSDHSEVAT